MTLEKEETAGLPLFNSAFETGVRAVVVLDSAFPKSFDRQRLIWFDHLVVHTKDVGGPESLHPPIPSRAQELLVRTKIVERGVGLMRLRGLVTASVETEGLFYSATEAAGPFVEHLSTSYGKRLRTAAEWLFREFGSMSFEELRSVVDTHFDRWSLEFQSLTTRADLGDVPQ